MWFRFDENDQKLFEELLRIGDDDLRMEGARELRQRLYKKIEEDAADAPLIGQARELYALGSDDDIEVDSDAAFSRGDDGTWVMMWGWVRHPEEDEEDEEEDEDENICRTCGEAYDEGGDGYDGECPDCADKTDQKLHPENYE